MFEAGEFIVYGSVGVCKVTEIGTLNLDGISEDRLYYTLSPVYSDKSVIYTPVDNEKVIMRPVITRTEADELVKDIESIETMTLKNDKTREEAFKQALHTCDYREWVKVIKTVYLRRLSRIEQGKKITFIDEKYLHIAEENLYGELAIVYGMPKSEVEDYITARVKGLETA